MDKSAYKKYVRLDCWALRRNDYLKKYSYCEACGRATDYIGGGRLPLQVHHLSYERLGMELDSDLLAVCESCHRALHGMNKATPVEWILQVTQYSSKRKLIEKWLDKAIPPR